MLECKQGQSESEDSNRQILEATSRMVVEGKEFFRGITLITGVVQKIFQIFEKPNIDLFATPENKKLGIF